MISLNGVITDQSEDHILTQLSDDPEKSAYTSVRTYRHEPWRLGDHLARLKESAALLGFELPHTIDQIRQWVMDLLQQEHYWERFIKIVATPKDILINSRLLEIDPKIYEGVTVLIRPLVRSSVKAKASNVAELVKAYQEAQDHTCYDALLLNEEKNVITEGSRSNILWVRDGSLYWCDEALSGITQADVLKIAEGLGVPIRKGELPVDQILEIDELFLTQTSRGIVPIVALHDIVKIREGQVGPLTKRLMKAFQELTQGDHR